MKYFLYLILLIVLTGNAFAADFTVNFQPNQDVWLYDGDWTKKTTDGAGQATFVDVAGGSVYVDYWCQGNPASVGSWVYKEFLISDSPVAVSCQADNDLIDSKISVEYTNGQPVAINQVNSYWKDWPFGPTDAVYGSNFDGIKTVLTNKGLHDFYVTYSGHSEILEGIDVQGDITLPVPPLDATVNIQANWLYGPLSMTRVDFYKDGRIYGILYTNFNGLGTKFVEQGDYVVKLQCRYVDLSNYYFVESYFATGQNTLNIDCEDKGDLNIQTKEAGQGIKEGYAIYYIDSNGKKYYTLNFETDESGNFVVPLSYGKYEVSAYHKGYFITKIVNIPAETSATFDWPVPLNTLSVKLVDENNNAMQGVKIKIINQTSIEGSGYAFSLGEGVGIITTNSSGEGEIKLYNGKYVAFAECPGNLHRVKDIILQDSSKNILIKCGGAAAVVRIVNQNGEPTSFNIFTQIRRADEIGRYEFDDVATSSSNPAIFDLSEGEYNVIVAKFQGQFAFASYGPFAMSAGEIKEIIITIDENIVEFEDDANVITTTPSPAPDFDPNLLMLAVIVLSLSVFFAYTQAAQR